MDARTFLGLEATDDPLRYRLPLRRELFTPGEFLFGGCGLGAAVEAAEWATGRPMIWATAQYLGYATGDGVLDVIVEPLVVGKGTTQARVRVVKADGSEVLGVQAALGSRPSGTDGQWAERPDVPGPNHTRPRTSRRGFAGMQGTIMDTMEIRQAVGRGWDDLGDGTSGDGRSSLWVRMVGGRRLPTSGDLAMAGDHVPSGIGHALGMVAGGNSLDNTIRVARLVETEWILVDIRLHAIADGFGHGTAHLWAEDGTLLGSASQSCIVRVFPDGPPRLASS